MTVDILANGRAILPEFVSPQVNNGKRCGTQACLIMLFASLSVYIFQPVGWVYRFNGSGFARLF
jgi:uncharacterized protein YqhQ